MLFSISTIELGADRVWNENPVLVFLSFPVSIWLILTFCSALFSEAGVKTSQILSKSDFDLKCSQKARVFGRLLILIVQEDGWFKKTHTCK